MFRFRFNSERINPFRNLAGHSVWQIIPASSTQQHSTTQKNVGIHLCPMQDMNPPSQCPSGPRPLFYLSLIKLVGLCTAHERLSANDTAVTPVTPGTTYFVLFRFYLCAGVSRLTALMPVQLVLLYKHCFLHEWVSPTLLARGRIGVHNARSSRISFRFERLRQSMVKLWVL
jgi:hypothetical protein